MHKKSHTPDERHLLVGAIAAVGEHLQRAQDTGGGGRKGRQSQKELLSESERILAKTSGGLSLYERLRKDVVLLDEMLDLLMEFKSGKKGGFMPLVPLGKGKRKGDGKGGRDMDIDEENMMPITVQMMPSDEQNRSAVVDKFNDEELKALTKYYGAHPALLEGFEFFKNVEQRPFVAKITERVGDLTNKQPIRANVPQINVVIGGQYKVRAIIDSGSTNTILSSGLMKEMKELQVTMKPTSQTFLGVAEQRLSYAGILPSVSLQFADNIKVSAQVAVVDNDADFIMLIGNDIMGGSNSLLNVVSLNSTYSFYTVVDNKTNDIGLIHYLKNSEVTSLPVANHVEE